mmetsp:Transcript_85635/g.155966  ORF Transcript_85635/g.155966 Transcript_85635/m.155966 type:complete len:124 (+) Transcript_85635:1090-1461(+)
MKVPLSRPTFKESRHVKPAGDAVSRESSVFNSLNADAQIICGAFPVRVAREAGSACPLPLTPAPKDDCPCRELLIDGLDAAWWLEWVCKERLPPLPRLGACQAAAGSRANRNSASAWSCDSAA